jgi:negative regulator of flagellin synthesis FlgM
MSNVQGLGNTQLFGTQDVAATTASTTAASTGKASGAANAAALAAAFPGDNARLSAASTQIAPAADGDVRMDKVAALQSQIAAGTYNVSASDVADKMIGALLK